MMVRMMSDLGLWLRRHRLLSVAAVIGLSVGLFSSFSGAYIDHVATLPTATTTATSIAYNVDLEMDKARKEKTVEHYGEPIRDIVEQATQNNENKPDSKPTAENTYQRESWLNEVLPERIGKHFSQEDLQNMEN